MKSYRHLPVFICILVGFFFIFANLSHARENDLEKLRRESAKIRTLQADFVQKKFMKILSRPLISEGCFYYSAPDSLRWEYFKPLKSIVIAHQNKTKRYMYSEGKMVEDKMGGAQAMKIVLNEIAGWMSGKFDRNPAFRATVSQKTNTFITLTPVGEGMSGVIEKIEITLSPQAGVVQAVKIFEGPGNFTQIDFKNVKVNTPINQSVFQDVQ
ncbi:MAG: outer membrane lipoprotein carrier protein LolA [Deltaproteobacteria bacterium]|nr:outer membrane lipoprotein carrier protein LolA [Deltaproteobacteria bacterium]